MFKYFVLYHCCCGLYNLINLTLGWDLANSKMFYYPKDIIIIYFHLLLDKFTNNNDLRNIQ